MKSPKDDLIRIGLGMDAELAVIARNPIRGRTTYVCKSKTCIEQIATRNSLDRALKTTLTQDSKDTLRKEILCKLR